MLDSDEIWLVRADGEDARQVTPRSLRASQPCWSPDGQRIAFMRRRIAANTYGANIWTARPDGTDLVQLTANPPDVEGNTRPRWSPKGGLILYLFRGGLSYMPPRVSDGSEDSWTFWLASPGDGCMINSAEWSPQGDGIVYINELVDLGDNEKPWSEVWCRGSDTEAKPRKVCRLNEYISGISWGLTSY